MDEGPFADETINPPGLLDYLIWIIGTSIVIFGVSIAAMIAWNYPK